MGDSKAAVEAAEESPVAELLGMRRDKITNCGKCKIEITTDNLLLLCNHQYPEHATIRQKIAFGMVLCSSLCPEQMTQAFYGGPPGPRPPGPMYPGKLKECFLLTIVTMLLQKREAGVVGSTPPLPHLRHKARQE